MSKKVPKQSHPDEKEQGSESKKRLLLLWGVLLAVGTLLGYSVLIPRIVPSVSDPVDPNDPFSCSVTITNSGFLTLDAASLAISPRVIEAESGQRIEAPEGGGVMRPTWGPQDLASDHSFTVAPNDLFVLGRNNLAFAQVEIVVNYEYPVIHWKMQERFPFYAKKQSNGRFYWYSGHLPN
jgi:hypothetical protein